MTYDAIALLWALTPQILDLHPFLQHSRIDSLSRLRAVQDSVTADDHPDSGCRCDRESAFSVGIDSNRWILFGIAVELHLIVAIDYTAWGNLLFGAAPIELRVWMFFLPFTAGMLILEELRKLVVRRYIERMHHSRDRQKS